MMDIKAHQTVVCLQHKPMGDGGYGFWGRGGLESVSGISLHQSKGQGGKGAIERSLKSQSVIITMFRIVWAPMERAWEVLWERQSWGSPQSCSCLGPEMRGGERRGEGVEYVNMSRDNKLSEEPMLSRI